MVKASAQLVPFSEWVVSLLPHERLRLHYPLTGRRRGYYYDTGEDALVMELHLESATADGRGGNRRPGPDRYAPGSWPASPSARTTTWPACAGWSGFSDRAWRALALRPAWTGRPQDDSSSFQTR